MPASVHSVTRPAHAKLNLALAVGPPRASDGLHPICSWFAPIDLADTVTVTREPNGSAGRCEVAWAPDAPMQSPIDWPPERELAARALGALERAGGRSLPALISVQKRIPVGGGLGGGSSDAAATLLALRDLFALEVTNDDLGRIAVSLGSDVPYFLLDPIRPAIVEGVGESVCPAPSLKGAAVVLIFPPFGTATGAVYRAFDHAPEGPFRVDEVRAMATEAKIETDSLFNDLADPAERVEPRLAGLRVQAVEAVRAPVHITGSGSTMFVVCPEAEVAEKRRAQLSAAMPGCRTLAARLL